MLSFGVSTAIPGIYLSGAHCSGLPPLSGDICTSVSRRLVTPSSRPSNLTLAPIPASSFAKDGELQIKCSQVRTGTSSGHQVSRYSITSGAGKSITSRFQRSGDSSMHLQIIIPISSAVSTSVPVHGITQLGLRSHPIGPSAPETITMSLSSTRSDKPVYTTASIRLVGPWPSAPAVAGPIFPYYWNPHTIISGRYYNIYGCLYPGVRAHMGDSQVWGTWALTYIQAPYQLFGTQGDNVGPAPLGSSVPGLSGFNCYGQHNGRVLYEQAGRDLFPFLTSTSSESCGFNPRT